MKNVEKTIYLAPSIEVIELETESAVMTASIGRIEKGKDMFGE